MEAAATGQLSTDEERINDPVFGHDWTTIRSAMAESGVSLYARRYAAFLRALCAHTPDGACQRSKREIAELFGSKRNEITQWEAELRRAGVIEYGPAGKDGMRSVAIRVPVPNYRAAAPTWTVETLRKAIEDIESGVAWRAVRGWRYLDDIGLSRQEAQRRAYGEPL